MLKVLFPLSLILLASPATAEPVSTAIAALTAAFGAGGALAAGTIAGTAVRLGVTFVASQVSRRAAEKKLKRQLDRANQSNAAASARRSQFTSTGGLEPLRFVVGRSPVAGHLVAPPMSQPFGPDQSSDYLSYVLDLGDIAGCGLQRVAIDGQWVPFSDAASEPYGRPATTAPFAGRAWLRYYDGSQTSADPYLLAQFGSDPERPWQADMVGRGNCYAVITVKADPDFWSSEPRFLFEMGSIPLYDPRFDSSVGGSGAQRWGDRATWAPTENPKVIHYNILRGITLPGYGVWGGRARAEDLPLDNWFAAMNACDVIVSGPSGAEPSFRFGYEIATTDEPADICEAIDVACRGQTAETGGRWKTRVGGPGLPVYFFTDDDVLVSRPQEMDPFRPLDGVANALSASFVDPDLVWEPRSTAPLTSLTYELQDGLLEWDEAVGSFVKRPRRLQPEMRLLGVAYRGQVDRILSAEHKDLRRDRTHDLVLPPDALMLEPLDVVAWTSSRNQYDQKLFEVLYTSQPARVLRARVGLREVDPADDAFDPSAYITPAAPSVVPVRDQDDLEVPGVPIATERLYATRTGALRVAVDLTAAPSPASGVLAYRWQRLRDGVWLDELLAAEPRLELLDVPKGALAVRVRAEARGARASAWQTLSFDVAGLAATPAPLPNPRAQAAGGLAVLTWEPHPDLDVRVDGWIEVRHSRSSTPTRSASTLLGRASGSATTYVTPLQPGFYLLTPHDSFGPGPTTVLSAADAALLPFAFVDRLQEDDEFQGDKADVTVVGSQLQLTATGDFDAVPNVDALPNFDYIAGGVVLAGVYTFATGLTLPAARRLRLRPLILMATQDIYDDFDTRPGLVDDWESWDGLTSGEGNVWIEVQITLDDPTGTPTWSAWQRVDGAEVVARGLRARAHLTTTNPSYTPVVTELQLQIDEVN